MNTPEYPYRYYMEHRPISICESIRRFWMTWKWNRNEIYMRPVKFGEAGYDKAPFEATTVIMRDVFTTSGNVVVTKRE